MPSAQARAEARRALERRLVQERALFAGAVASFAAALYLDISVSAAYEPAVYVLIALCGLTGAGYDGAREGLKDLDLIAGLLEREGAGASVALVPFLSKGHYELWLETPAPGGPRRFGLSFANSLLYREKRSIYLLMFPLAPSDLLLEGSRPRKPFVETGTGGVLEGKTIEYHLWSPDYLRRPFKRAPREWRLFVYATPGRPLNLEGLLELKRRGEAMAEKVTSEGPGAVAWGTTERFRPPLAAELSPEGRIQLRDEL